MKWRAIYLATRNLFIAVGMIAIGVWFPNQDWNIGIISAALVAFIWWMFYRIALVSVGIQPRARHEGRRENAGEAVSVISPRQRISQSRHESPTYSGRIRQPGKRAVASYARFIREVEEEKADRRAGELAY